MGIRFYKPCTPGTRYRSVADFFEITRKKPTKSLVSKVQRSFGRNNRGIITSQPYQESISLILIKKERGVKWKAERSDSTRFK